MKNLKDRLARLEQESAARRRSTQCSTCRDWPAVCWMTVDTDGTEIWETEEPRECPHCGWVATVVVFHTIADWRSVTPPGRCR
jgi:hypothetical protein